MDLGNRANILMDTRAAITAEFKAAEERYHALMKFAL